MIIIHVVNRLQVTNVEKSVTGNVLCVQGGVLRRGRLISRIVELNIDVVAGGHAY